MKMLMPLIICLFISLSAKAGGVFEFTYGIEKGEFYIQDQETKADDTIDADVNNFGFNFEQFFTGNQKYIIALMSKSINYSNPDAEFSQNDLQESDVRLAWAYASGNFQVDLGIIQKSFYTFEIINNTTVEFDSDKVKAPYVNLQYVLSPFSTYFIGAEYLYIPSTKSENSTDFDTQMFRLNLFKQMGSVMLGGYYHRLTQNIETSELLIQRNTTGFGIDIIFNF